MGTRTIAALVAVGLVVGCGGSGDDSKDRGRKADRAGPTVANRVRDSALGYSLLLPRGWSAPKVPPGQAVPLAGGGAGCAVGPAGLLPDVSGPRLLTFARNTARRRAAAGAKIEVEGIRGDNAPGALVRISRSGQQARSALFASAGGGVAVTCRVRDAGAAELDQGLSLLLSSVRLDRDRALERAQPRVVAIQGVQAATLRRSGSRVEARISLKGFRSAPDRLRSVVGVLARAVPRTDIGVNATNRDDPRKIAFARFLGGTGAGTIQVPPAPPRRFTLD